MAEPTHHRRHADQLSSQRNNLLDTAEHMAALHHSYPMLVVMERVASFVILILQLLKKCC
jgi:hypothetical protein